MPTPPAGSATVDLTTSGNFGIVGDGLFLTGQLQPAGTGVFNSFVQIEHSGVEQGYNTDGSFQFNETGSHNHNHSVLLADVPIVIGGNDPGTVEGLVYREFLLDLNEPAGGSKNYLSLDSLQLWQEEAGNLGAPNFNTTTGFAGAHTNYKAYDLDTGGNHWVALTSNISHGSGQSDVRVLIPDSVFINDTSHRYVYLYSLFGQQGTDWTSAGGFEEWGLHGPSGGANTALNITKEASVPGGTADHDGEIITYSIKLFNTGNVSLTGITVTDPSVGDLTRGPDQVGNNDLILNVGEIWTYSAHHVVTQQEIDSAALANAATIDNTVSAGSDQTGHLPEQLDHASTSVPIEARPLATLDKAFSITSTDEQVGTTSANAPGDVINYTVSVSWAPNGNTTLTNPVVTDPSINVNPIVDIESPIPNTAAQIFVPLRDGDNNLGDDNNNGIVDPTDQNNARDPGETWQYVYLGDTNQDGFHDPGETWTAFNLGDTNNDGIHQVGEIWVGDANQNGVQEEGEKWQFKNLADTNNDGLQNNDETWTQYQNAGDVNQSGTQDGSETFQYYNIGDTNQNGFEDSGETFQYYNVGDTNHDGIENNGETFQFNHNLPAVDVNEDGFNDGDANFDGRINFGETWLYTASYTVTQADIDNRNGQGVPTVTAGLRHDNTASVVTNESATANDSVSVPIDQNPHLIVSKTRTIPDTSTPGDPTLNDGKIDSPADDITYTITVVNDGNMTLTSVNVNDSLAGTLTNHTDSGAGTHGDGELNVGETWTYTVVYNTQQSDIDNHGNVDGTSDDNIHNGVTVTTAPAQGAGGSASANVAIDYRPHLTIDKTASIPDSDNDGKIDSPADNITYTVTVVNDGNVTLTGVTTNDSIIGPLTSHTETGGNPATNADGKLNVGETWTYTAVYDTQQADIDNHGNVDGTADNNIHNTATVATTQGAGGSDSADVAIDYRPHLTIDKMASIPDSDNDGKIDSPADDITYMVTVVNDGNVTLTGVTTNDSIVGPLTSHTDSGPGTHADSNLDVGETWTYTAVYGTQQSDIDNHGSVDGTSDDNIHNTATVTTTQGAGGSDSADVAIDYRPHLTIDKMASIPDSDNDGKIDSPADDITYIVTVVNDGNVTLTGVTTNDSIVGPLTSHTDSGAGTHGDGNVDVGETWTYTAVYDTQQSDIDDRGAVDGSNDPQDTIHNQVTVATTQGAGGSDSADVGIDYNPDFTFSVTALGYHDDNPNNNEPDVGEIIDFSTFFTNTGNVTLTGIAISSEDGLIAFQNGPVPTLAPGGTYDAMTGTHLIQEGESGFEETYIGQSDQVGNILVDVEVVFAELTAFPPESSFAAMGGYEHERGWY